MHRLAAPPPLLPPHASDHRELPMHTHPGHRKSQLNHSSLTKQSQATPKVLPSSPYASEKAAITFHGCPAFSAHAGQHAATLVHQPPLAAPQQRSHPAVTTYPTKNLTPPYYIPATTVSRLPPLIQAIDINNQAAKSTNKNTK